MVLGEPSKRVVCSLKSCDPQVGNHCSHNLPTMKIIFTALELENTVNLQWKMETKFAVEGEFSQTVNN